MSETLFLVLKDYNGGSLITVPCTYSAGAVTIPAISGNSYTSLAYLQLQHPNGGSPIKIPVTIHDDGTLELGSAPSTEISSGVLLFERESGGEPLPWAAAISSVGAVTLSGVSFTGSGAPTYDSSNIGAVDESTVVVRFSEKVVSADFTAGVTIKKNTVQQNITSATRQANHAIVYYVLDTPADANDVVTWEYSATGGDIADETDGTVLADVTAKTVTNTIGAIPPEFDSAEIGAVLDTTVAVTFTTKVDAAGNDFSTGVTIKVNGSDAVIASGTRQADHHIVYYVIPAVDANDVVTWEYDDATGLIVNEDDGGIMATLAAQPVTNTVAEVPPEFDTGEIGTIAATTIVLTFTTNVAAEGDDYSTGVIVNVNAAPVVIASATRQANHKIVRYVIPAVDANDTVTWEYDDTTGLITNEDDGSLMVSSLAPETITNNVAGVPPEFDTGEVGLVTASTVVVTYTTNVFSTDYKVGVTINVNAVPAVIDTATRQADHKVVHYVLTAPVVNGNVVTLDYDTPTGDYANEDDGALMADIVAAAVTNNVA